MTTVAQMAKQIKPSDVVSDAALAAQFRAFWDESKLPPSQLEQILAGDRAPMAGTWRQFLQWVRPVLWKELGGDVLTQAALPLDAPQEPAHPAPVVTPPVPPMRDANPLVDVMLDTVIAGLQARGYAPQHAVSAQQAQTIAEDVALSIAEMVTAQLQADLASGKYQIRHQVAITVGTQPERMIDGKAPQYFARLLKLAMCRVPVLLVGPAGGGKTTAAKMVAKALGLSFTRVSLSAGVDEGSIQGWLLPVGEGGKFTYVPSAFVDAYVHGGVVLLDELDAADANMLIILNAPLDNGGWHIPLRIGETVLHRHPDFVVIAAANTWGHGADREYAGANQLDQRTLSRFAQGQIACDYDQELEQGLYAASVVQFGQDLRARCRSMAGWRRDVSTRDIALAHAKLAAFEPEEAWYEFFASWNADECERVGVRLNHSAGTAQLE